MRADDDGAVDGFLLDQFPHLVRGHGIEAGSGFVQQNQFGFADKGLGESGSFSHAVTKGIGSIIRLIKEIHVTQHSFRLPLRLLRRETLQAGEEGKLFGSVTSQMISDQLAEQGLKVAKKEMLLEDSIKELGSHKVTIKLGEDLSATIKVKVDEESE